MSRLVLRGLGKRYGATTVLRGVDLQVEAGEFCVFVGPSGCGKSTLLRLVAGLDDPSEGEIEIDGAVVNDLPPARRGIAMVFQSYALYPHMSAHENMAFGLRHQKLPAGEIDRRVQEAARILHLESLLARKPRDLSGGERQRVAIGRAIVRKPRLFLFDEPLSNLDAALRVATRAEIARLHRALGAVGMIYVTHDQVEAMTLADRIVLLQPVAGRPGLASVAQAGAPLDLYHRPASRFVAGFIGSPAMNFLDGHVAESGAASLDVRLDGFACTAAVRGDDLACGAPVTLGIRPEHVVLGDGTIETRATHVERLGEFSYVYLELPGRQALIAKTPRSDVAVGDTMRVDLPPAQMHAFRADGSALQRVP